MYQVSGTDAPQEAHMSKHMVFFAALLILATSAGARAELVANQVLVVANTRSDESVKLARTYANLRGIPDENIALLDTSTHQRIERSAYEKEIIAPLRKILIERGLIRQIRCFVLMRGVPIRVMGPPVPPPKPEHVAYKTAADRAHYRLAVDYRLLASVGSNFPDSGIKKLRPIGKLFRSPAAEPARPLTRFATLKKNINWLLAQKQVQMGRTSELENRAIAERQLMALHLDIGGLKSLIAHIEMVNPSGGPDLAELQNLLTEAQKQLTNLPTTATTSPTAPTNSDVERRVKLLDAIGGALLVYSYCTEKAGPASEDDNAPESEKVLRSTDAAVDSELAGIWWPRYPLKGPLNNLLNWRVARTLKTKTAPLTIMTARIDGPTYADALRIVNDSIAAQSEGLKGNFYIDAGGKLPQYDDRLRKLARFVRANTPIKTILDEKQSLFAPGACPDAGLYVGWYSLRKYIPAFAWVRGSVGWHVASFEATNLRDPQSTEWCVKMIQNGIAATVGAVDEPLLHAFPLPDEFFALLLTGKYTLAECYWRTTPLVSWRMVLIGDPLYNPFANNPQVGIEKLPEGLAPQ